MEVRARELVEGLLAGQHRSPYRGESVEFADHRSYTPGDDPRLIDWKVFARRERYYVRQHHEESNLVTTVLLDASASMTFGSQRISKLEYACVLASALVYLVIRQNDAAAVGLFDREASAWLPPAQRMGFLTRLTELLERLSPTGGTDIGASLAAFGERIEGRGIVVVISDFLDRPERILDGLPRLRQQGHEVIALHVLDPAEQSLPWHGPMQFHGLEDRVQIRLEPQRIRASYLAALEQHLGALRQGCSRAGIDYRLASTDQPPHELLLNYLGSRQKLRRTAR